MVKANNTMTQEAFALNKANLHANLQDEKTEIKQAAAKVTTPQPKSSSKFAPEFDDSREGVEPTSQRIAKPK